MGAVILTATTLVLTLGAFAAWAAREQDAASTPVPLPAAEPAEAALDPSVPDPGVTPLPPVVPPTVPPVVPPVLPGFSPPAPSLQLPPRSAQPAAGSSYQIRAGDNLFTVARRAYGLTLSNSTGAQRVAAAQAVIDAAPPELRGPQDPNETIQFRGSIGLGPAFLRRWRSNPQTEAEQVQSGTQYAVIVFPDTIAGG